MNEQIIKQGIFEQNLTYPTFRKNGKRVTLTRREFDLMAYFMQHPNTVFSRVKIMNQVWGKDNKVDVLTINTYVGYLRKKLGGEYFKSAWGWGYRFVPDYTED